MLSQQFCIFYVVDLFRKNIYFFLEKKSAAEYWAKDLQDHTLLEIYLSDCVGVKLWEILFKSKIELGGQTYDF